MAFCGAPCGVLPFINKKDGGNVEGEYNEALDSKTSEQNSTAGDGSVDLKGRPVSKTNTGGWKTASLIFGAAGFESVASVGIAFTLFSYLSGPLHMSTSKASIHTNIYWGTSFITSLFGGFISDAYLGRFWTSLISAITELLVRISTQLLQVPVELKNNWNDAYMTFSLWQGLSLMMISMRVGSLRPDCPATDHSCPSLEKTGEFIAFVFALYMVALGAGCLRPCLATLGADQFDIEDPEEKKQIRSYFNWFFFAMSVGAMVGMMVVVYVAESVSWFWSFTIMGIAMFLSTACLIAGAGHYRHKKPQGSPLTRIAQVIVAASRKKKMPAPSDSTMLFEVHDHENGATMQPTLKRYNSNKGEVLGEPTLKRYYSLPHTKGLGFLDKAAIITELETGAQSTTVNPWHLCTITQVEELKTMLRLMPIIFIISFLYIVVAQIQTWAVAEGYTMERTFGEFNFPPPSLSAISVAFVLFEIAIYDRWFVPFMQKYTNHSHGITHLQRIGIGLAQSILAMAYGAVIETARLRSARNHGFADNPAGVVPISIFWLLPMWILASSAELFAYVGCFEFFWQEMPVEMRSLGGGLSLFAISFGYFQSGGLIIVTNAITKNHNGGWVHDPNLNKNQLNYFYLILMVLSIFNAFGFVMSTKWYNYVKFINTKASSTSNPNPNADHAPTPLPDLFKRSEREPPPRSPPQPHVSHDLIAKNRDSTLEQDNNSIALPDYLPRSESRTPLRSTNNSDDIPDMTFASPTPPPQLPRNFFSHVFSPRHDTDAAAAQPGERSSPRFIKLERSRSRARSK